MDWLKESGELAEAADRAAKAGDMEAFVDLICAASACLKIACNLTAASAAGKEETDGG